MLVNLVPISFQHKTTNRSVQNQRVIKPNLAPLAYDTVSFSGKENKQIEIDKIKADLKDAIKNNDAKTIYRYFGIDVDEDKEGYLTISAYKQPSYDYTFEDLGMDENKLFEKVKYIKGNANFYRSRIENLGSIESIGGMAYFRYSKITNLGNLKSIGGHADFRDSNVTNLGNLESIGEDADFSYSQITNLGNLESIGEDADFSYSQITNLGNLKSIGGHADFRDSNVTNLGNLKSIGGNVYIRCSKLKQKDFANIKVGGTIRKDYPQ